MDFPTLDGLDHFAGFASLINGLILWPLVRSLKKDHGARLDQLEEVVQPRKPSAPTPRHRHNPRRRNR